MNFPLIKPDTIEAVRRAADTGARSTIAFGVQALRLLSEIRDNTSTVSTSRRLKNDTIAEPAAPVEIMRIPTGDNWLLQAVTIVGQAPASRRILLNNMTIYATGAQASTSGVTVPLSGGSALTIEVEPGSGPVEYTLIYQITEPDINKPGPWNVDYRSVDAIGTMSSIHKVAE